MSVNPSAKGGPILWPLKGKIFHPVFFQQRPKWTGGRPIPVSPIFPWDRADAPSEPRVVHQLLPYPPTAFRISGFTKDSTGTILAGCTVHMLKTVNDQLQEVVVSGPDGYFQFKYAGQSSSYYLVAYKPGSPDVAGTTINTLTGQ
jgi:hypothetical protein